MLNLAELADKYEIPSFCDADPSQFLHYYSDVSDVELASFFAAMLSFGNRSQFIPKIKIILELADKSFDGIFDWVFSGNYVDDIKSIIPCDKNIDTKFYRFYSYSDLIKFFDTIKNRIKFQDEKISLGEFFHAKYNSACSEQNRNGTEPEIDLADIIASEFSECYMVPHTKNSCKKRVYMFMRWMVRQNSPVDLGIWDWYPQSKLIIPLDTHVMQEAENLGLIKPDSAADIKTAKSLTAKMNEYFPGDPVRSDFALFALGVSKDVSE